MNKTFLKLTILSIGLITVTAGPAISPALGTIAIAFPHVKESIIKLLITLPALIIIPIIFLSSYLTKFFPKKYILLTGISLYFFGGIGGGLVSTMGLILSSRVILGIGVGLIMPISTSLVTDFYKGKEQTIMIGYLTAVINLSGVILFLGAGSLALISWRASFGIYFISVAIFILVLFFLPKVESKIVNHKEERKKLPNIIYFYSAAILLLFIVFFSVPSNMALFIQQERLGSSLLTGGVIALTTLAAFIGGLFYNYMKYLLKSYFLTSSLFIMAVGFALIGFSQNIFLLSIGVVLMGYMYGSILPMLLDNIASQSRKSQIMRAMAFGTSMIFVGQFISPPILDSIRFLFAQDSIRFIYQFLAYSVFLASLGFLIYLKVNIPKYR